MRRTEGGGGDFAWLKVVICPLFLLWIIAEESDRGVVFVDDGDATFEFGNYRIVTVKTDLAWPAQMLGYRTHEFSIEIKMAEATVLAVADKQQRLVIAAVDG